MTTMELSNVRANSLRAAKDLGYAINEALPLLDRVKLVRSVDETVDPLFAMYCVAAAAYGFDRGLAANWLSANSNVVALTPSEQTFLETGKGATQDFKFQIEGIWALYWSCGLTAEFSFGAQCPQDFVTRLPDIKKGESAQRLRSQASLIGVDRVVQMADTAYCIHWAVRDSAIRGRKQAGKLPEYAVRERRKALDWLLEDEAWDDISLDT